MRIRDPLDTAGNENLGHGRTMSAGGSTRGTSTARPRGPTGATDNPHLAMAQAVAGQVGNVAGVGGSPTFTPGGPKRGLESGALANTTLTGNPNGAPYGDPARGRLEADTAAGYANADKYGIGAEGSMGRLNDERKAEIDALLAKQQAGLDGMTPAEMQAAKEQGNSTINQQLATNMTQFGDLAAGNGVRGGSAMGLQMQAMQQAQGQSGELARKLILDNMAQKNIAMDRYGNTLQTQQGVGLGIQDSNNQSANAEKLARELAAGNYTSQLDSYRAGDKSDDFTQQGLDLTKDQINILRDQMTGKKPVNERSGNTTESAKESFKTTYGTEDGLNMVKVGADGKQTPLTVEEAAALPTNQYAQSMGYGSWKEVPYDLQMSKEGLAAMNKQNSDPTVMSKDFADKTPMDNHTGKASCIITTEAMRQGLLDERWREVTREYKLRKMKREDIQVYWAWAQSIVDRMAVSPLFARAVSAVLPGTLAAMAKEMNLRESAPLHGKLFFGVYKALNAAFRPIVLKRNGEPMAPKAVERMFRIRAV